jgi:hypothetical protein
MGEWELECLDCGWRGMVAEVEATADKCGEASCRSCPECGGSEFKDRVDPDDS